MELEPMLPWDLERAIFGLVAELYPTKIPTLLRVCRRVQACLRCRLEPLLYRVINLDDSNLIRAIEFSLNPEPQTRKSLLSRIYRWYNPPEPVDSPRAQFFKNTVRHVMCTTPELSANADTFWQTITRFLRLHPAVFELAVQKYSAPVKALPSSNRKQLPKEMRPTRLTLELVDRHSSVDLTDPLFSSVTHLTLLSPSAPTHQPSWLPSSLVSLTHLCVTQNIARGILPHIFTMYPCLQAFVVYFSRRPLPTPPPHLTTSHCQRLTSGLVYLIAAGSWASMMSFELQLRTNPNADGRVVLIGVPDFFDAWERGARRKQDMWVCVDQFIARKRTGEIEQTTYVLDKGGPWVHSFIEEIEEKERAAGREAA
ncbi:hypothetical protein C8R45DRAFT_1038254 [Mycena sanguinolenta]|nr:hypothetical protein C8R45DRAFT_1038254 [Mycena sanguinolenta]